MAPGTRMSSMAMLSDATRSPGLPPFFLVLSSSLKRQLLHRQAPTPGLPEHPGRPQQADLQPPSASRPPGATTLCASGHTTPRRRRGLKRTCSRATRTGCATSRGRRTSVFQERTSRRRRRTAPYSFGRRTRPVRHG